MRDTWTQTHLPLLPMLHTRKKTVSLGLGPPNCALKTSICIDHPVSSTQLLQNKLEHVIMLGFKVQVELTRMTKKLLMFSLCQTLFRVVSLLSSQLPSMVSIVISLP